MCHAVLGSSAGIGFAYARHFAALGHRLVLVARRPSRLEEAAETLRQAGAIEAICIVGDLADPHSRAMVLERLAGNHFASVLVGGPSPPAGRFDKITSEDFRLAMDVALLYPLEVLRWALAGNLVAGSFLRIVGSAATQQPLKGNPFLLSAVFRSELERLTGLLLPDMKRQGIHLRLWKPVVVLTELSSLYAASRVERAQRSDPRKALELIFGEPVPTAEEYVQEVLRSEGLDG